MPSSNIKIELSLKDIPLVKNLVELLEKHFDDLPAELQDDLKILSEKGINDFTVDDFESLFPDRDNNKLESNFRTTSMISMNKILKRVVFVEDGTEKTEYPETFYLKCNGETIIEW